MKRQLILIIFGKQYHETTLRKRL